MDADIQFQASMFCNRKEECPSWACESTETFLERILGDEVDEDCHHHHRYLEEDQWMVDLKDSLASNTMTNNGLNMKRSKSLEYIDSLDKPIDNDIDRDEDDGCIINNVDNNVEDEFHVTNFNNHNSTGGVLMNSDESKNKNRSSNKPKSPQFDTATRQLSKRIKRISTDEFMKMTAPFTRPPTPPPMPQLSPIPTAKKSSPHRYANTNFSNNPGDKNIPESMTLKNNSKRVKIIDRKVADQSSPINRTQSKCEANPEPKIVEMEDFNMKFVCSGNWKSAMISGVDPKELYFRHQHENQSLNSLLNEFGFLEAADKSVTKSKKNKERKEEFLENRNFSSNRSYSPEVLDRMRQALDSAGEWDWDKNQPNKVHHNHKERFYEIQNTLGDKSQFRRSTYRKNSKHIFSSSDSSSEPLFEKQEILSNIGGRGNIPNPTDSSYSSNSSTQTNMSNPKMLFSSVPTIASAETQSRSLKFSSESGVGAISTAVLMGKYVQKKPFPLDDMTYNQGARRVLQYLHSLWMEQTTCDITVIANGGSILAHKVVLAAWSQTLASLFKQHNSTSVQSHEDPATINMAEYPKDIVADVINFLYTTDIKLDLTNIGIVAAVARELDIMTLANVCGDFLIKTCEPDSVLLYYSVAANNELSLAQRGLEGVIASSITEISEQKYFLNLPYLRFHSILSNPQLCGREIDIFQGVVRWVDFCRKERLPLASSLLKKIRFQHMCMNDLAQKVEFASWIFVHKEPKELLLDAYKFHAMLSSGVTPPGNFKLDKPRCASHNKKKPLLASLEDFRKEYNNKLRNCLVEQGATKCNDCSKKESPKHITPVEITSKEWNKELNVLANNSGCNDSQDNPSCYGAGKVFEHVVNPLITNLSASNNAQFGINKTENCSPSDQKESNRISTRSLETNLKNLKEAYPSIRNQKNNLNDDDFQKLLSNDRDLRF